MKCKYGNARCLCQNCKRNASYEHCTHGYCIGCFECEEAGEAAHDVWMCTGQEKIQEDEVMSDNVNHPDHYTSGGVECIDGIRAALGDGFPAYCAGNVIKYVWRHRHKNGVEDLKKARVYLDWMIEAEEAEA